MITITNLISSFKELQRRRPEPHQTQTARRQPATIAEVRVQLCHPQAIFSGARPEENAHGSPNGTELAAAAAHGEATKLWSVTAEEATSTASAAAARAAHGADCKATEAGHEAGGFRQWRNLHFKESRNLGDKQDLHRHFEAGLDSRRLHSQGPAHALQGGDFVRRSEMWP